MTSPVNDRGSDAFLDLLHEAASGPGPKAEALEALSLRPVWLATWEPRAEGYRTLINADGEEALAVFSSEKELKAASVRFDWLAEDGSIATHQAIGGDILRHAWTREYAFVVIDIGSDHSLEFARAELRSMLREIDTTGPFRTSRPPPPPRKRPASSSFPPPNERISTLYTMGPSRVEKVDPLSDMPTKPHKAAPESEPPTKKRTAVKQAKSQKPPPPPPPSAAARRSSRPARKRKSERPGPNIEEVQAGNALLGDFGTYGAASVIPNTEKSSAVPAPMPLDAEDETQGARSRPSSSSPQAGLGSDAPTAPGASPLDGPTSPGAPPLQSDWPTAPNAESLKSKASTAPRASALKSDIPTAPNAPSLDPGKLRLPKISGVGVGVVEPEPPPTASAPPPAAQAEKARQTRSPNIAPPSIGDGINLAPLLYPPDEVLLKAFADVLRGYFEVEWGSYCLVARPKGDPTPAVALRIADNFRDNVTAIIKELSDAGRRQHIEIDVLLIDGHDMLRKARERAYVFYPWKPKPFGV